MQEGLVNVPCFILELVAIGRSAYKGEGEGIVFDLLGGDGGVLEAFFEGRSSRLIRGFGCSI